MKKNAAYQAGLAMRKKVLGADYVKQTLKNADELLLPFQELLTEFAWGSVWTRPGLSLKTRSMLTLAMCIALNRPHEIKLHLRGALRNGCDVTEIRELLLHSFIYCGGPAAVDAFNVIRTALPEIAAKEKKETRRSVKKAAAARGKKAASKRNK
jgi:4-carboxymuconolactone decarboxylase